LRHTTYINDLLKATENKAVPIKFADDTSILITSPNNIQFQSDLNVVSGPLNKCFKVNLLSLHFDKTYFIHFTKKITCTSDIQITYEDKFVHLLKQNIMGCLLIILFLGRHTLNVLSLN